MGIPSFNPDNAMIAEVDHALAELGLEPRLGMAEGCERPESASPPSPPCAS